MNNVIKVFTQGDCFSGSIHAMLASYTGPDGLRFKLAKDIMSSDMVLYTGGADISPGLYGEGIIQGTYYDQEQDKSDVKAYSTARKLNKLQVGICRGAQFLNVMNGGKMWQDVNHHAGNDHLVQDCLTNKTFLVSSLHHQQIILPTNGKAKLLAFCNESTEKRSYGKYWKISDRRELDQDVEAFWISGSKCLGVQWHPECGPQECIDWFFHYIESYRDKDAKHRRGDEVSEPAEDRKVG